MLLQYALRSSTTIPMANPSTAVVVDIKWTNVHSFILVNQVGTYNRDLLEGLSLQGNKIKTTGALGVVDGETVHRQVGVSLQSRARETQAGMKQK